MIQKINEAFIKLGFYPSRNFNPDYEYHLVRNIEKGKQVITLSVDDNYPNDKYVFDVSLSIYFDEIDEITQFGNLKYIRFSKIESNFELDFLNIPVVDFDFDFITNTYTNQPLSNKLKIDDEDSLNWLIQLYDYDLKDFFKKYSNIEEAKLSLNHPYSFYKKNEPHWNGCILKLLFTAQNSKSDFENQILEVFKIYEKAHDGFKLNLPKSLLEAYIIKLKSNFGY
ncbi:hypothetical protein [Aureispira anguillae]|uniref:Uncharacterized protein n=1 Tax=Aureispira anguillae TaxID=2864201 RepID=A0A916DQR2_9BACT|nr:hypothetical protein [Aureispira anguillae]BDS11319.1 hypothetical protein AsAng_0020310 [Aureispira anguillae]